MSTSKPRCLPTGWASGCCFSALWQQIQSNWIHFIDQLMRPGIDLLNRPQGRYKPRFCISARRSVFWHQPKLRDSARMDATIPTPELPTGISNSEIPSVVLSGYVRCSCFPSGSLQLTRRRHQLQGSSGLFVQIALHVSFS